MNFLAVFKSRGFWIMVALFILFDLAVFLVMKEARAYWSGLIVEAVGLLAYAITRSVSDVDKPIFFLNKNE